MESLRLPKTKALIILAKKIKDDHFKICESLENSIHSTPRRVSRIFVRDVLFRLK